MADVVSQSFARPDNVVEFPPIRSRIGSDVRGIAVHEAARIMSVGAPREIMVSEMTRALAGPAGLAFEDRGEHELRGGLDPEWRLAAFVGPS